MPELPAQPQAATPNRKQEVKEYTEEEKALIAASWQRIGEYDPRTEKVVKSYEQLSPVEQEELHLAAKGIVDTIRELVAPVEMKPSALKWFSHPSVYALSFALRMDYLPDIIDAMMLHTTPDKLESKIHRLLFELAEFSTEIAKHENTTLHPSLVDQAVAYIPTHPLTRISDLTNRAMEGFGASADRDTEDAIFGEEA